ncbi:MAG: hypothetical protein JWP38_330 [Herbaspirillum sp.]|jgi:hypothetical protein|nr:hypothetical protein [Herbaspirillum sp.]
MADFLLYVSSEAGQAPHYPPVTVGEHIDNMFSRTYG